MTARVRVTRVIVIEGDEPWVDQTLSRSVVHRNGVIIADEGNSVREVACGREVLDVLP